MEEPVVVERPESSFRAAELVDAQEQSGAELDQRRKTFSDTLYRLILRQKEVHPEKFQLPA